LGLIFGTTAAELLFINERIWKSSCVFLRKESADDISKKMKPVERMPLIEEGTGSPVNMKNTLTRYNPIRSGGSNEIAHRE
jgi:hypothetical protein